MVIYNSVIISDAGMLRYLCILLFILSGSILHGQDQTLWTVAWSPDGDYIATGGSKGTLTIYDAWTFQKVKSLDLGGVIISRIKWHPEKPKLAVITQSTTFTAKIYHLKSGQWTDLQGLESAFRGIDWNTDGSLLAVSENEGEVSVFNESGSLITRFSADPKSVAGIDWHPEEDIMVTVGSQIGVYDSKGNALKVWQPRNEEVLLLCVQWHPSGEFFAVGDYGELEDAKNKLVQFWKADGEKIRELRGSSGEYRNIRWNTAGDKLATASDALRIWSSEGYLLMETETSEDYLWGVDWSAKGPYICTSSTLGNMDIWNRDLYLVKRITGQPLEDQRKKK